MNNLNDILAKIRTLETKLQSFLISHETAQGVLIPAREYMECYKFRLSLPISFLILFPLVLLLINYNISTVNRSKTWSSTHIKLKLPTMSSKKLLLLTFEKLKFFRKSCIIAFIGFQRRRKLVG